MKLKFWQVDAFSAQVFGGNPAAIVPLDAWLDASAHAGASRRRIISPKPPSS